MVGPALYQVELSEYRVAMPCICARDVLQFSLVIPSSGQPSIPVLVPKDMVGPTANVSRVHLHLRMFMSVPCFSIS